LLEEQALTIDNYDYHQDSSDEQEGGDPTTYVAFFLNWAITRYLLSPDLEKINARELAAVRAGSATAKDFLDRVGDGKLLDIHLQKDVAQFAKEHYQKHYFNNFNAHFSLTDDNCYTVPQSTENMNAIGAMLDQHLVEYLLMSGLTLDQIQTPPNK
jgi:hypothetical protein